MKKGLRKIKTKEIDIICESVKVREELQRDGRRMWNRHINKKVDKWRYGEKGRKRKRGDSKIENEGTAKEEQENI